MHKWNSRVSGRSPPEDRGGVYRFSPLAMHCKQDALFLDPSPLGTEPELLQGVIIDEDASLCP